MSLRGPLAGASSRARSHRDVGSRALLDAGRGRRGGTGTSELDLGRVVRDDGGADHDHGAEHNRGADHDRRADDYRGADHDDNCDERRAAIMVSPTTSVSPTTTVAPSASLTSTTVVDSSVSQFLTAAVERPSRPANLVAAVAPTAGVGSRQVRLSWTRNGGSAPTDYVIRRLTDGVNWTTVNDGVSTATTYLVGGLTNGVSYRFRVAARNAAGTGPWSSVITAKPRWKPSAPSNLVAAGPPTAGVPSGQVRLSWTAPSSNGGSAIDFYDVQRASSTGPWSSLTHTTSLAYTATGLSYGPRHYFRVIAYNAVGKSPRATPAAGVLRALPRPAAHVVRASDGTSWYVDLRGGRHWIPNGGTYDCLVAQGRTDYGSTIPIAWVNALPKSSENAVCVRSTGQHHPQQHR